MPSPYRYVAYLSPSNAGSTKFRQLLRQLPPQEQKSIKTLDYKEVVATIGDKKPKWLTGTPTLATFTSNPRVYQGQKAIDLMQDWVNAVKVPAGAREHTVGTDVGLGSSVTNPAELEMRTLAQPTSDEVAPTASIANDDLYRSIMPHKSGTVRGGGGKISASELAAYERQRNESEAVRARQGMMRH